MHSRRRQPNPAGARENIVELHCTNRRHRGFVCYQYLGSIQVDVPNVSRHHCRNCKITYEHTVLPDGTVHRRLVPDTERVTPLAAVVIEVEGCP